MAASMHDHDENIYESRFRRTIEVRVQGTGQYLTRYDFAVYIDEVVGLDSLEACGPTARRGVYHFTFESESDADKFFEAGDFMVKDRKCFVNRIQIREREQRYKVRVYEDKCGAQGFEHVYALTRTFLFKTKHPENVPYVCQWKFTDLYGKAFFTMADRPP
jgi:hypothetical protein